MPQDRPNANLVMSARQTMVCAHLCRLSLGLLNVAGYYDDLLRFIERSRESGFLWPDVQELLLVDDQIERLLQRLHDASVALKAHTPPELQDTAAPGGVARGT
jgi:predicted Rossmann-fold nucleotide-binding protein